MTSFVLSFSKRALRDPRMTQPARDQLLRAINTLGRRPVPIPDDDDAVHLLFRNVDERDANFLSSTRPSQVMQATEVDDAIASRLTSDAVQVRLHQMPAADYLFKYNAPVARAPESSREGVEEILRRTQPRGDAPAYEHGFTHLGPLRTPITQGGPANIMPTKAEAALVKLGGTYEHTHPTTEGPLASTLSFQDLMALPPRMLPGVGPRPTIAAYPQRAPGQTEDYFMRARSNFQGAPTKQILQSLNDEAMTVFAETGDQRASLALILGMMKGLADKKVYKFSWNIEPTVAEVTRQHPELFDEGYSVATMLVDTYPKDPAAVQRAVSAWVRTLGAGAGVGGAFALSGSEAEGEADAETPPY